MSRRRAAGGLVEEDIVGADELPKVLHELHRGGHVSEAVVLSTCNRVEIYADVDRFHGGVHEASSLLARRTGMELAELGEHLYVNYEDAAVLHLFRVAPGLGSMGGGEPHIRCPLRAAYAGAPRPPAPGR